MGASTTSLPLSLFSFLNKLLCTFTLSLLITQSSICEFIYDSRSISSSRVFSFVSYASAEVLNEGIDCWNGCGRKGGKCDFCGDTGVCCRKGYKAIDPETDLDLCKYASDDGSKQEIGCSWKHCCVESTHATPSDDDDVRVRIPCEGVEGGLCDVNELCADQKECICVPGFQKGPSNKCEESTATDSPTPPPSRPPPTIKPTYDIRTDSPSPSTSGGTTADGSGDGDAADRQVSPIYWPIFVFMGGAGVFVLFILFHKHKLIKERELFRRMEERMYHEAPQIADVHMQNLNHLRLNNGNNKTPEQGRPQQSGYVSPDYVIR